MSILSDTHARKVVARIGIYGDIHLSSKNYGGHRDYPAESLYYFQKITETTRKYELTHLIGCGDFSFGRFSTLEYRRAVEIELEAQNRITNGNRYEIFGNHDEAGYGMTERDYYIENGLLKPSTNLTLGNLHITMVDYGKAHETPANIVNEDGQYNVIIAHDFYKFANSKVANFGKAIELDHMSNWFGANALICGHIHKIIDFSGFIQDESGDKMIECEVHYLGCMSRPAFTKNGMDTEGHIMIYTVYDDGEVEAFNEVIPLWDLDKSFNIEEKAAKEKKQAEIAEKVDITDVVKQLDAHDKHTGNPEDIINAMEGIDERYKAKAIDLLHRALG